MLTEFETAPLAVFVVWEPILVTDSVGPTRPALSRIPDPRAMHFWDSERLVSERLGGPAAFGPGSGAKIHFDMAADGVVWDFAAVYEPGFRWKDSSRSPAFAGGPVVEVAGDLRSAIASALGSGVQLKR